MKRSNTIVELLYYDRSVLQNYSERNKDILARFSNCCRYNEAFFFSDRIEVLEYSGGERKVLYFNNDTIARIDQVHDNNSINALS